MKMTPSGLARRMALLRWSKLKTPEERRAATAPARAARAVNEAKRAAVVARQTKDEQQHG